MQAKQIELIPSDDLPRMLRVEPRDELEAVEMIANRQYNTWKLSKEEIERAIALLEQFRRRIWGT